MRLRVVLLFAATILGWGLAWPTIKMGITEIPPWSYRGITIPTAALIMFVLAKLRGEKLAVPVGQRGPLIVTALLNITGWVLFSTLGLSRLASGHASIIAYTMPLWAFLFALAFGLERASPVRVLGVLAGISGIFVLLSGEVDQILAAPQGPLLMLASAIVWGAGTAFHKRVPWRLPPIALTAWMLAIGSAPIAAVGFFIDGAGLHPISTAALWATIFVIAVPTVVCWISWFSIVKAVPVTVSSVGILLVPMVAVLSGNLLLHEAVGWREIGALALVCVAIVLVLRPVRVEGTT